MTTRTELKKIAEQASKSAANASRQTRRPCDPPSSMGGGQSCFGKDEESEFQASASNAHAAAAVAHQAIVEAALAENDVTAVAVHRYLAGEHTTRAARHLRFEAKFIEMMAKEEAGDYSDDGSDANDPDDDGSEYAGPGDGEDD